jgi:hypothetical protein
LPLRRVTFGSEHRFTLLMRPLSLFRAGLVTGLVACCLFLSPVVARAASESGRPILRAFSPRTYGADAQNLCAVQDAAGIMYFGNTNGVLTYDGATWRVIRTGYSENIRGLALADDGNIYVGGTRQIGYLRPTASGREYVSLIDRLPAGNHDFSVFLQVVAQGDSVYFVTAKLILLWRHGAFTVLSAEATENDLLNLQVTGVDVFLCSARQPLRRIRGDRIEVALDDPFLRDKTLRFVERAADGALVLGTLRHGFFRWKDGAFTPLPTEADALLKSRGLFRARRLSDGSFVLMILNQGGTLLLDPAGKFVWQLDESAGLPSTLAGDAVPDREGGLWLCLSTGLARLEWPAAFSLFDRAGAPPLRARTMLAAMADSISALTTVSINSSPARWKLATLASNFSAKVSPPRSSMTPTARSSPRATAASCSCAAANSSRFSFRRNSSSPCNARASIHAACGSRASMTCARSIAMATAGATKVRLSSSRPVRARSRKPTTAQSGPRR